MARAPASTDRPGQRLLFLPAVEAAGRRLEALLLDGEDDHSEMDGVNVDEDADCFGADPLLDLDAQEFGCSIALFRPLYETYAGYARNWIIPLLDGYGRVTHVTDNTFESSDCDGLLGTAYGECPSVMSAVMTDPGAVEREVFNLADRITGSDIMALYGKKLDDAEWKQMVSDLFDALDVAVVDTSELTETVLWEIETCYHRLPPERVILIAHANSPGSVEAHSRVLSERLAARGIDRDAEPLLAYAEDEGLGLFAVALHVRMRDIVIASTAAYETALEAAEKTDDHWAMMTAYYGLGEASYNLGNYQAAMDWFHLALVVAGVLKDRAAMQSMHLRLQAAAAAAGDDEKWLESFEALGDLRGWAKLGH